MILASAIPTASGAKRQRTDFNWFALGGVLVNEEDEQEAPNMHREFCRPMGGDLPSPFSRNPLKEMKSLFGFAV